MSDAISDDEIRAVCRGLASTEGLERASSILGCSAQSLAAFIAGLRVRPGTVALLRAAVDRHCGSGVDR